MLRSFIIEFLNTTPLYQSGSLKYPLKEQYRLLTNSKVDKDYDGYPPALDNMLEKCLLFKINVKSTNILANDCVYTVMNVSDNPELFDSNQPKGVPKDNSLNVRLKDVQSRAHENEDLDKQI
ncbi:hypothetical protein PIB30_061128 [Stylosanthes scabra]|uniref:Uncharacterized protein n=1 Tax=Stylosanthes scabra TaxID=79078 RepID=A0ABU6QKL5_9FABA|nr:hypothetical protein [Stylosanthes scabra]